MIQPNIEILDIEAREVEEDQWSRDICYISIKSNLKNEGASGWAEIEYETRWGPETHNGETMEGLDNEIEWVFLERGETKTITSAGLEASRHITVEYSANIISTEPKDELPLSYQDPDVGIVEIRMLTPEDPRLPSDPKVTFEVTLQNNGGDGKVELRFDTIWAGMVQDSCTCTYDIAYGETITEYSNGVYLKAYSIPEKTEYNVTIVSQHK